MTTQSWLPLGVRQGWTGWMKPVPAFAAWAAGSGIEVLDLGAAGAAEFGALKQNDLRIGTVDLLHFPQLMSDDSAKRRELIDRNITHIKTVAALGGKVFFTCLLPGDVTKKRSENYALAVESFQPIAAAAAGVGATLAVEGYPGGGPYHAAIACTPESTRQFLKDVGPGAGLNYDPSHLLRLGVDHIRFLKEFLSHVKHVHAKDTDIDAERQYEFGTQQSSTFAADPAFGGPFWRYTIPGSGQVRWVEIFKILRESKYAGAACIELEDARFNGTEAGEKAGFCHAMAYLRGVVG